MVLTILLPTTFMQRDEKKVNSPFPKMTMTRTMGRTVRMSCRLMRWKFQRMSKARPGAGAALWGASRSISSRIGWTRSTKT